MSGEKRARLSLEEKHARFAENADVPLGGEEEEKAEKEEDKYASVFKSMTKEMLEKALRQQKITPLNIKDRRYKLENKLRNAKVSVASLVEIRDEMAEGARLSKIAHDLDTEETLAKFKEGDKVAYDTRWSGSDYSFGIVEKVGKKFIKVRLVRKHSVNNSHPQSQDSHEIVSPIWGELLSSVSLKASVPRPFEEDRVYQDVSYG